MGVPNLLPQSVDTTRLLIAIGLTALAFALCAAAFTLRGNRIIAAFLAAGAWLFGALGVAVWFLQR
jgi:vacuolar-type H+-ATPase subunit I/STV1